MGFQIGKGLSQYFPPLWRLLAAVILASVIITEKAHTEEHPRSSVTASERKRFDIPSQSLEDALIAYASVAGVEVFVDHALAADQLSAPLQGVYGSEEALRHMLATTGLELHRAAEGAYTLVAPRLQEPPMNGLPHWAGNIEQRRFFAALQLVITRMLCTRPETVPGQYRAALALWIDPVGNVVNVRALGTNRYEQAVRKLLSDMQPVSIGLPPPAGLAQPVTLVILPRSLDQTGDCASKGVDRKSDRIDTSSSRVLP